MTKRVLKFSQYHVVVRDNIAYVMGYMTPMQREYILGVIQGIDGMEEAKMLITLVSDGSNELGAYDSATDAQPAIGTVYAPTTYTPTIPINNGKYPIVQMENPATSYVQLYNGTDKP